MNLKIYVAARFIKISQNLFVKFNPVLNIGIALNECPQKAGLFGVQNTAQTPVGEFAVANKGEPFDLYNTALNDLEHNINPVVRAPDDARFNGSGYTALIGIGLSNCIGVITHLAHRIDPS